MPGTKWWMWWPRTSTFPERPPAAAHPVGREPGAGESAGEAREKVEEDGLGARRRLRTPRSRPRPRPGFASWVETIACSAVSKTFSGSATAGSSAASRARLRVSFASSPTATVARRRGRERREPKRDPVGVLLPSSGPSLIGGSRISEAYDVIRVDAASDPPQVEDALCLGDDRLRVDLVVRGDDHGQVALGEALFEPDARRARAPRPRARAGRGRRPSPPRLASIAAIFSAGDSRMSPIPAL